MHFYLQCDERKWNKTTTTKIKNAEEKMPGLKCYKNVNSIFKAFMQNIFPLSLLIKKHENSIPWEISVSRSLVAKQKL